jgi:hypothetical protein
MLDDLDKLGASTKKNLDPKKLAPPNAFDQYLNGIKKTTAATEAQTQTVGMLNSAQERLRISMEADAVAKANNIVLTDKQKQAASDAGYAAGLAKDQLEGMNLVFANKTPLEQYTLQLDLLTQKMTLAGAKTEEIARAQKKLAEQFGLTWEQIGASIGTTFGAVSQIFGQYAKENKTLGIASKVFGLAQVAINTAIAISKANTLLPPANFAAMAAAAAVGVAQAATIAAQQFATGGSFKVGGVGGIDSQLVTFAATPGEMVDVRKPGATGASAEITVNGIGPRDFFTGDMLRAMVEGLNAAHGDGYKLKFAG